MLNVVSRKKQASGLLGPARAFQGAISSPQLYVFLRSFPDHGSSGITAQWSKCVPWAFLRLRKMMVMSSGVDERGVGCLQVSQVGVSHCLEQQITCVAPSVWGKDPGEFRSRSRKVEELGRGGWQVKGYAWSLQRCVDAQVGSKIIIFLPHPKRRIKQKLSQCIP